LTPPQAIDDVLGADLPIASGTSGARAGQPARVRRFPCRSRSTAFGTVGLVAVWLFSPVLGCSDDSNSASTVCDAVEASSAANTDFPGDTQTNREWRAKLSEFSETWRTIEPSAPPDVQPDLDLMATRFEEALLSVPEDDAPVSADSMAVAFPYEDSRWVSAYDNAMRWIREECGPSAGSN
jgi:hypothetical protein